VEAAEKITKELKIPCGTSSVNDVYEGVNDILLMDGETPLVIRQTGPGGRLPPEEAAAKDSYSVTGLGRCMEYVFRYLQQELGVEVPKHLFDFAHAVNYRLAQPLHLWDDNGLPIPDEELRKQIEQRDQQNRPKTDPETDIQMGG